MNSGDCRLPAWPVDARSFSLSFSPLISFKAHNSDDHFWTFYISFIVPLYQFARSACKSGKLLSIYGAIKIINTISLVSSPHSPSLSLSRLLFKCVWLWLLVKTVFGQHVKHVCVFKSQKQVRSGVHVLNSSLFPYRCV
jgi:hypothetical protein